MVDVLTPAQRSFNMSRIKGKNTNPEMRVRSVLHSLGYRYRLHVRNLPGCPDIVLPKYRTVVFVHGCFWHMHDCKYGRVTPATNAEFWQQKRKGNVSRDARRVRELRMAGWRVLKMWECWTREPEKLNKRLADLLQQSC
jgi:DNA mismatch endonuclease (patch repair protein)